MLGDHDSHRRCNDWRCRQCHSGLSHDVPPANDLRGRGARITTSAAPAPLVSGSVSLPGDVKGSAREARAIVQEEMR